MKDWCDEDGAKRLREKINAYWAERGYEVDVDLIEAGFVPAMRSARTDVRSNMVNGMPRSAISPRAPRGAAQDSRTTSLVRSATTGGGAAAGGCSISAIKALQASFPMK